jgi:hypothetical protein
VRQRSDQVLIGPNHLGHAGGLRIGDAKDRAHLAIAKITRRGRFYKPKGMPWRTFHRLCDRFDHHNTVLDAGHVRAAEALMRRYG